MWTVLRVARVLIDVAELFARNKDDQTLNKPDLLEFLPFTIALCALWFGNCSYRDFELAEILN